MGACTLLYQCDIISAEFERYYKEYENVSG